MTTKTKTAQTEHGDVEYPVVECSSCGQETRKEDAQLFIIGDVKDRSTWGSHDTIKVYDKNRRTGWACEFCRENGPVGFPQPEQPYWRPAGVPDSVRLWWNRNAELVWIAVLAVLLIVAWSFAVMFSKGWSP